MSSTARNLESFFLARYGIVVRCAQRFTADAEAVEDIVQQTYVEFLDHAERWKPEVDLTPVLIGITKNVASEWMRQHYRHRPERIRQLAEFYIQRAGQADPVETNDPLEDRLDALGECLERLNSRSRKLVELHYWQEITLRKLSEHFQVDEKNLSKMLCRVRSMLKDCIEIKMKQRDHFQ